jgi:Endonuclease-reverse transcriptase
MDYEYVSLNVIMNGIRILLHAFYRPPQSGLTPFIQKLECILDESNPIVIAGDLNINKLKENGISNQITEILKVKGADIINNVITRSSSKTLIDYFITIDLPQNVTATTYTSKQLLSSDHNLLLTILNITKPRMEKKILTKTRWNYDVLRSSFVCDENAIMYLAPNDSCEMVVNSILDDMSLSSQITSFVAKMDCTDPPACSIIADMFYYKLKNNAKNILKKSII